jgi:hypothetical protein
MFYFISIIDLVLNKIKRCKKNNYAKLFGGFALLYYYYILLITTRVKNTFKKSLFFKYLSVIILLNCHFALMIYNFILIEYKNALIFCLFLLLKNKAFLQFNNLILLNFKAIIK